jgi:N-acetyl-D-muramate 6-phosphate phosphatase
MSDIVTNVTNSLPFDPLELKVILFDLDGTLVDTDDVDVGKWARRVARAYRSPDRANSTARRIVMLLESPVNALFTLLDLVGLDTFFVRLLITVQGTGSYGDLPAVKGIDSALKRLAMHYTLGVVTTRSTGEAKLFITALGLSDSFKVFAGRDTTWRIKPHPEPVLYAARELKIDPAQCLMVGDTTVDIRAGRRAGAWTCGVLCGYGESAELRNAGAHIILDNTAMIDELLLGPESQEEARSFIDGAVVSSAPQPSDVPADQTGSPVNDRDNE